VGYIPKGYIEMPVLLHENSLKESDMQSTQISEVFTLPAAVSQN
jgi:hypothetical protein